MDAATADLVVAGKIGRSERDVWSASIEMRRADGASLGTRELATRSKSCSALDEPVALALGIMLDVSRKRIEEERTQGAATAGGEGIVGGPQIAILETPARSLRLRRCM